MGGEDDVVAHLAACDGRIVAHHGVVQTHTELKVHMLAQQEPLGNTAVFACAAIAHHTVGEHDTVVNACRGLLVGEDGHIVQCAGVLNDAMAAHLAVAPLRSGEVTAGHLL